MNHQRVVQCLKKLVLNLLEHFTSAALSASHILYAMSVRKKGISSYEMVAELAEALRMSLVFLKKLVGHFVVKYKQ